MNNNQTYTNTEDFIKYLVSEGCSRIEDVDGTDLYELASCIIKDDEDALPEVMNGRQMRSLMASFLEEGLDSASGVRELTTRAILDYAKNLISASFIEHTRQKRHDAYWQLPRAAQYGIDVALQQDGFY